jgi:hypothetical protein
VVDRVVELTLGEPRGEVTHWTGRAMAEAAAISLRSVQRIWVNDDNYNGRLTTTSVSGL